MEFGVDGGRVCVGRSDKAKWEVDGGQIQEMELMWSSRLMEEKEMEVNGAK